MQIYFIVSFVAIICYINSLCGDFVHDDLPAIVFNKDVLGTSPAVDMLLNDFWGMRMKLKESHKSYRPLTTLSFRYFITLISLRVYLRAGNKQLNGFTFSSTLMMSVQKIESVCLGDTFLK